MTGNYKFSRNKRSKGLRDLEPSVFIQMSPPHPAQGPSAECGSYERTPGSSNLIPSWINQLITTFEYLNLLCLWAPPFQVPLLVCALWIATGAKFGVSWAPWAACCKTWDKKDLKRGAIMLRMYRVKLKNHMAEWGGWGCSSVPSVCVYMPRANVDSPSEIGLIALSLTCIFLCLFQKWELPY